MSAEVENSKEEETKEQQQKKTNKEKFLENWQLGIKILELLICCLCLGFAYDSVSTMGMASSDMHHIGIMYTAYTGFILINLILVISRLYLEDSIPYRTVTIFSMCGAALFLITGVLLVVDRSAHMRRYSYSPKMPQLKMLVTSIVFAFINALVFTADAIFTFRRQLICAGCIGFVYEPARAIGLGKNHLHHFGLMYTSFTGYLMINLVLLISRAIGDRIPYRTSLMICCCGSALYLVTAILLSVDINEVKRKSFHPNQYRQIMMFTTAILAWVNTGVFAIEGFFTWRRKQDF